MRRLMLLAVLVVAMIGASPGCASAPPAGSFLHGWQLNSYRRDCVLRGSRTTCGLYAGRTRVATLRVRRGKLQVGERLALEVENQTSCLLRARFEILQPDAFGPQSGVVIEIPVNSYRKEEMSVPLYWRNGLRGNHFVIRPTGPIVCY